jgi:lipoprotein-anchoring transpeptidase ErfK/SrfK
MRLGTALTIAAAAALTWASLASGAGESKLGRSKLGTAPKPVVGTGVVQVPKLRVRLAPTPGSRVVAELSEFRLEDFSPRPVLAIGVERGPRGKPAWYRIVVPGRPNGRTGWVRAGDVSVKPVGWQIVVYRDSRIVQLWKGAQLVHTARVAVGAPGMETPLGLYYVTRRFKPIRQTFLGSFAFETSAYSKLSDWPGGGIVGLHGTTQPWLLGRAVSHGCVRLSNATADFFRSRVPVGTPIRIKRG